MMSIELLAEYKEKMKIATEMNDIENAKKYYQLFVDGYKELTGENFEDLLKDNQKLEQNKDDIQFKNYADAEYEEGIDKEETER